MKLTILGSGTSHGIPVAGCACAVCSSGDRRDTRYRSSILVEGAGGEIVIVDTGPEFRLQAIRAKIAHIDALFLTHSHADHLHGLDDVRPFTYEKPLNVYANSATLREVKERFDYIFNKTAQEGGGRPKLILHHARSEAAKQGGTIFIGGLQIEPLPVKHGVLDVLGWKFSEGGISAVYVTDLSFVPDKTLSVISRGTTPDILVIGSLRETSHATHFSFSEALEFAKKTEIPNVFLTHICHSHSHTWIEDYCRRWTAANAPQMSAAPAYDELELIPVRI